MLKIENAYLVRDAIVRGTVYVENGRILSVHEEGEAMPAPTADAVIDGEGCYLTPGFIDIHVHGGGGGNFADGDRDLFLKALRTHVRHGTTSICPTLSSNPVEALMRVCELYRSLLPLSGKDGLPSLIGLHLEGPYFALSQAGAQKPECMTPPIPSDYRRLLALHGDVIAKWSFAPELSGVLAFADALREHGVVASFGHTDATLAEAEAVLPHGVTSLTHFYSGMSTIVRKNAYRVPGVVELGYLHDELYTELIADGSHLPPSLLRMIYKLRPHERLILITDALRQADLPEGTFVDDGMDTPCIIEDGVAKLPDRTSFAGSVATTDRLLRTVVEKAGYPLAEAVAMLTKNPAASLGLTDRGEIAPGKRADLLLLDRELSVKRVMVEGNWLSF